MEYSLKKEYVSVKSDGKSATYGGNQLLSSHKYIRQCGCGIVACCDLLAYIAVGKSDVIYFHGNKEFTPEKYDEIILKLSHRYFPVVPPFGMNGIALASGLNMFFMLHKLPFFAIWDFSCVKMFDKIAEMLSEDIPVIISVGPNFPRFWKNEKISLYRKISENQYKPSFLAKAHFMTVTGLDETWMRISSWGKELYMKRSDYVDYTKRHSSSIVSNICYVKRTVSGM